VSDAAADTVARGGRNGPRRHWFLVNFGILYAITFVGGAVAGLVDAGEPHGWPWLYSMPVAGLIVVTFTAAVTLPSFAVYLVVLRLARRRWPRRRTAWILTPLLAPLLAWVFLVSLDAGDGSWWNFGIALACVPAAAGFVRV
jgi:hypothetical protein